MKEQVTPLPWDYIVGKTLIHIETRHDNAAGAGMPICSLPKRDEANAAFIVRAVNSHEALVSALEDAIATAEGLSSQQAMHDDWYLPVLEKCKSALALAKGKV